MNTNNTEIDCYCPKCNQKTHHRIHGGAQNIYRDDEDSYYLESTFYVVKCMGCDNVSFLQVNDGDEYIRINDDGEMESAPEYITYPNHQGQINPLSDWEIPPVIRKIYNESISALNNNCDILAAIGFRTTVEAICNEKGLDSGKLVTKINRLREKGVITKADCERLHQARFMGNDSTHEIVAPERSHLLLVLEVINNIINNLYIIDEKCRETFPYRFRDMTDFLGLLQEGLKRCKSGETSNLYGFLPEEHKYRREDIEKYEVELLRLIDNAKFTELQRLPSDNGKRQLYIKS